MDSFAEMTELSPKDDDIAPTVVSRLRGYCLLSHFTTRTLSLGEENHPAQNADPDQVRARIMTS